jgi:hypothetical protein
MGASVLITKINALSLRGEAVAVDPEFVEWASPAIGHGSVEQGVEFLASSIAQGIPLPVWNDMHWTR